MGQRILINSRLNGAGGVETHLLNLCRLLAQNRGEVTLVSRYVDPATPMVRMRDQVPVRLISTPFAHDLQWFKLSTAWAMMLWPLLLDRNFDVLLTTEASPFTKFLALFLRPGGQILLNRAGSLAQPSDTLDKHARDVLSGVLVESSLQAEAVQRAFKLEVPVISLPLLSHSDNVHRRERRISTSEHLRLAFLGRFDCQKGIYRLLDVWERLNLAPARLDFYGHGPERDSLVEAIRRRNLTATIAVRGGWADANGLTDILSRTDLVVLPSDTEGLPLVLLEAMAHGVPFVATDVGAVRTLAEGNPDVLVVPTDDESIINGIEEMTRRIRKGDICGERLQSYHRRHYGYEQLSKQWADVLL